MFLGKVSIQWAGLAKQSSAKLAINYLLGLNLQGLAETLSSKKWRKEDMLSIINEGACEWYNKYQSQLHLNDNYPQLSTEAPG
jgi:3-hydroxyisobutyrate dehydrogenase